LALPTLEAELAHPLAEILAVIRLAEAILAGIVPEESSLLPAEILAAEGRNGQRFPKILDINL
jgi:hypothetical protein